MLLLLFLYKLSFQIISHCYVLGNFFDVVKFDEYLCEILDCDGFLENLVHSCTDGLLILFIFYMSSNRENSGLIFQMKALSETSDILRCLIPIHKRHVAIHKDKSESGWVPLVNGLLNLCYSLLPIICKNTPFMSLFEA